MLLDAVLETRRDLVNRGDRQIAVHGAVTRKLDPPLDLLHADVMAILQRGEFAAQPVHELFHFKRAAVYQLSSDGADPSRASGGSG